jgi:hypothetical protein
LRPTGKAWRPVVVWNWAEFRGDGNQRWMPPASSSAPAHPSRYGFESAGGWIAAGVALVATLWRVSEGAQWRDDLAVVRGLGLVPVGGEGVVSTLLIQLTALVPIGGRLLRAAAVSAVAVAVTAALVYELTRRLLAHNARAPALGTVLALAAALMATLCPSWQLEGTIAGGAAVAVALALGTLLLCPVASASDARAWLACGLLFGLTLMESHVAGLVVLLAAGVQVLALRELPPRRGLALFALGAAVVGGFCALLVLLRPLARRAWVDLGYDLIGLRLAAQDIAAERPAALDAWLGELGVVSLALAVGATIWGLARRRTRWLLAPLVVFVAVDTAFPAARASLLAADPMASARLLALAAVAVAVALGVHTVALGLQKVKMPMARPAAVLLVVFDFTLVLVTAEDSAYVANRRGEYAAEVWTDEAMGALPPKSLVLVRSEAVAWRFWAARVVRGQRPDIVVVPVHLLGKGSVARRLIELEPALTDLVKDVAITGHPGEYSLSTLADKRPLYVELDPRWDRRLYEHLIPGPTWMRFSPHALGRSDRTQALQSGFVGFERVRAVAAEPTAPHPATLSVLQQGVRDQALTLAALGDRENLERTLEILETLDDDDPVAAELRQRMSERRRGRVDIAGLLP